MRHRLNLKPGAGRSPESSRVCSLQQLVCWIRHSCRDRWVLSRKRSTAGAGGPIALALADALQMRIFPATSVPALPVVRGAGVARLVIQIALHRW